ncbi:BQ5605_C001g00757 [Microbotryum silenes-dioicae]|uniref:BQ5605_C001g00757 protein n=1 Tax=Microbotryum silenes-dioicae TaxID=796604 RepID=A0A2X0M8A1_9BASI|nr:BQ5605_C001g00757 [Microbotryum silenes-dioicae]
MGSQPRSGPSPAPAVRRWDQPSPTRRKRTRDRPLNIAMICDYFFPKVGGVESHIYSLAEALAQLDHKVSIYRVPFHLALPDLVLVIIITHAYPPRSGIRYLPYGLKVYHIPVQPLPPTHVHATLPGFFTALPYIRNILIREQIDVLHAHASLSAEGMEGIFHARTLGVKAVFTDHSLFGLGNMAEIWGNKMLKGCLSDVEAVICVSHTGKENTVLRGALNPSIVHVIPNAVVASHFKPAEPPAPVPETLTIVCLNRLVYRKGIDLLIAALPRVCSMHPDVRVLIGGDGPKIVELDQMLDKHQALLRDRVELLGAVRNGKDVRDLLSRAQIFLNPSLTEAFGIGILEAACAGLFVVSTRVGGVPEVLPPGLVEFAEPDVEDLIRAISRAIHHVRSGKHDPLAAHDQLKEIYSWPDVAERTEKVYYDALEVPEVPVVERLRRYYGTGLIFGKMLCIIICVDYILLAFLDFFFPREDIDLVPKFELSRWQDLCKEELERTEAEREELKRTKAGGKSGDGRENSSSN